MLKPLTSSDIAKKYDILLDKRLELLDKQLKHLDEQHSLNIKKCKLEIELLERELGKKKSE